MLSETIDGQPYYSEVNELEIEKARGEIENILKEGLENEIISRNEFNAMSVESKGQEDSTVTSKCIRNMTIGRHLLSGLSLVGLDHSQRELLHMWNITSNNVQENTIHI